MTYFLPLLKRKQIILLGFLILCLSLVVFSCYPGDPISTSDSDTVTTVKEKNASFASKQSYARPDSVQFIDGENASDGDHQYDDEILAAIDRNMQAMGYNKVDDPDQADVHVLPMATTTEWQGTGCYPSWWCGWWSCYPGWCYPYQFTFTTGTIIVTIMDPNETNVEQTALWIAGLNGILGSGNAEARIDRAMDQAFEQSPYLKEGK